MKIYFAFSRYNCTEHYQQALCLSVACARVHNALSILARTWPNRLWAYSAEAPSTVTKLLNSTKPTVTKTENATKSRDLLRRALRAYETQNHAFDATSHKSLLALVCISHTPTHVCKHTNIISHAKKHLNAHFSWSFSSCQCARTHTHTHTHM